MCNGHQGLIVLHSFTSYQYPITTTQKKPQRGSPVMPCERVVDERAAFLQCDGVA